MDMRAVELTRTFADPQHVRRGVVPVARGRIDARHGLLIVEQQGFVAGKEINLADLRVAFRRHADRRHEAQRFGNLFRQGAVTLTLRAARNEAKRPLMDIVQIGIATVGEGAQQVQRRRRLVVGLQQALRIRNTRFRREFHAIDVITAVAGQGHVTNRFDRRRARLAELTGNTADLDHRTAAGKGHDDGHLQDQSEGIADIVGREFLEAFGAVTALQQEGLAIRDFTQSRGQTARLTGKHQRRQVRQLVLGSRQRGCVRIIIGDVQGRQ